jgi:hypothetical protein
MKDLTTTHKSENLWMSSNTMELTMKNENIDELVL